MTNNPSYRKVWIVISKEAGEELDSGWDCIEIKLVTFNKKKAEEIKALVEKATFWNTPLEEKAKAVDILQKKYNIGYWSGVDIEVEEYDVTD